MVVFIVYFILWIAIGFEFGYGFKLYLDYRHNRVKYTAIPTIEEEEEEKEERWDIVYVLKNDIDDGNYSELRYSLRSLVNFPHRNVWFAGGQPERLKPDYSFPIDQKGTTKWEKVCYTLKKICENKEISENFWLFNDDFFVMAPNKQYHAYTDGDLAFRILTLEDRQRGRTKYSNILRQCLFFLKQNNLPTTNYALHLPMLINKIKALEVLDTYPEIINFKNIYGNYIGMEAYYTSDVKYSDNSRSIDKSSPYLSSMDRSFLNGAIGNYIRESFPEKSKYEID